MKECIVVIDPLESQSQTFYPVVSTLFRDHAHHLKCSLVVQHSSKEIRTVDRAIITVRTLYSEAAALAFWKKIMDAPHSSIEWESLLSPHQEPQAFLELYASPRIELLVTHDRAKARSMGANITPSVVKIDQAGHMICLKGQQPLEVILAP